MSAHRFFLTGPLTAEEPLALSAGDLHHLRDVLRLTAGDEIVAVGTDGVAALLRLTVVGADGVSGEIREAVDAPRIPRIWLVQGLAKGEKMDLVVRMVTELGCERIVPLMTSRSVVRLDVARAASRVERWHRIAAGAAKQAQLTRVPEVTALADVAGLMGVLAGAALVLVAWEDAADAPGIEAAIGDAALPSDAAVAIVIGPEGGFSSEEVAALVSQGARVVSLGATVLRTETAGVVATALALAARGGLGGA
ncbi:MAG: 16S rRNA (uracil(1498)-N(3))-methyltransferase [Actinobacteria bacterium]|nr:MAG: 16S rRNA (uracil(1498)-N(3))-methyltransferase [Actinomycetota bacterium]